MKKRNVLVTGGNGQVGSELNTLQALFPGFNLMFTDADRLDLTNERDVTAFFSNERFEAVINCAAYTAVDAAEDNEELCFKVNDFAVGLIARICKQQKIRLIHISTDYVFDGQSNQPIDETVIPRPLSVYGKSKLQGEQRVLDTLDDAYIIRTAWVYSTFGKNFVKTISSLAQQRPELNVVADQIGTPTYANDLAQAILRILESVFNGEKDEPGIYHFSNEGAISWYDFAYFIVQYYQLPCQVKPIRTAEYPTKAVRPQFTLLDKQKIRNTFGIIPAHWHDGLIRCLDKMK